VTDDKLINDFGKKHDRYQENLLAQNAAQIQYTQLEICIIY